jgi:dephospho-CoA kinase
MFAGKPIIGIIGGIGSGKSYVAKLFGELGCLVIDSDAAVRQGYDDPTIQKTLSDWWGDSVFQPDGKVNRSAIGARVFSNKEELRRLEELMHGWVAIQRDRAMSAAPADTVAFIWDSPLLLEKGLNNQCDAVIYVDAPLSERQRRVKSQRSWEPQEIIQREKLQFPLDKKRKIADYVLVNSQEAADFRSQVRQLLSRIVAGLPEHP